MLVLCGDLGERRPEADVDEAQRVVGELEERVRALRLDLRPAGLRGVELGRRGPAVGMEAIEAALQGLLVEERGSDAVGEVEGEMDSPRHEGLTLEAQLASAARRSSTVVTGARQAKRSQT